MSDSGAPSWPNSRYGDIPAELSFEEIIKNRTAPPCSLNDFMDYLYYVEHNAEPLQFFLWYLDYVQRWSTLLPRQKALSPPWDPEQAAEPRSRFIRYSHKRERSLKMSKVLAIMDMGQERTPSDAPQPGDAQHTSRSPSSSHSHARSLSSSILSPVESTKPDWQPFTIPPFRDELTRIVRHYISSTTTNTSIDDSPTRSPNPPRAAPRALPLSPADRTACLAAAQHTTHPSALQPAFLAADAALRGAAAHGSFLRWARRNANPARCVCLCGLGAALVLLGCVLDALLVASRAPREWRVFGPANDYSGEPWTSAYKAKGLVRRVFDETVPVQDKALVMWQDRTVFVALVWAGAVSTALAVGSLFVPSGGLF
ncbi:be2e4bcd-609b-4ecc-9d3a-67726bd395fa [Thermothielavioides terrestris]|uniref:Be2e4bcd-609b-4ecc-9d3a-67726bd395fa n=1 Tax=Thermothielavioides terrestris TaxID=2587410 RepID=A0A3S4BRW0_9PEZI|nr:be2e4bcd-609b-4ecc-9d3a-67726bd395fa [Thermothielavioides terrestris]